MKSTTFFYADAAKPAHVVIGRDGLVFRYKPFKGKVEVRLCKDGYGPTLRQFRMVEEFAQQARTVLQERYLPVGEPRCAYAAQGRSIQRE
jgi:hypothetical protein